MTNPTPTDEDDDDVDVSTDPNYTGTLGERMDINPDSIVWDDDDS